MSSLVKKVDVQPVNRTPIQVFYVPKFELLLFLQIGTSPTTFFQLFSSHKIYIYNTKIFRKSSIDNNVSPDFATSRRTFGLQTAGAPRFFFETGAKALPLSIN
jgi:hypothetical protein